jgi:hypothetical protein
VLEMSLLYSFCEDAGVQRSEGDGRLQSMYEYMSWPWRRGALGGTGG